MSEITAFVPAAFVGQANASTFMLRTIARPTVEYRHAIESAGLAFHSIDDMRAETLRALEQLWPKRTYRREVARITALWNRLDGGEALAPEEQGALDGLGERLARAWPRIAEMAADNARFGRESAIIAASLIITGWSNLDVAFRREAGRIPLATLDQVEAAIGPIAWTQLATACVARLRPEIPETKEETHEIQAY